ncbi:Peptidase A5, thermopsin, partial [mine drainage metagenome]
MTFNSTYGQSSSYKAPKPHYFVSGTNLTATGFIPFDAEIMIGGPGGGSTAVINGINATMNLMNYNKTASKYQNVKAAYDIGSETGETAVGVDVHNSGSTAYLSSGPGLVYGLWNNTYNWAKKTITSSAGTFMFLNNNISMINLGIYAWAPLTNSTSTFYLPSSLYLYDALENYHIPTYGAVLSSTTTLSLTPYKAEGIYTPIIVTGNSQLAKLVTGGAVGLKTQSPTGSAKNPYVINASSQGINPLFGALNDYEFPTFPGVLIMNTTTHIVVNDISMPVSYTGSNAVIVNFFDTVYGMQQPLSNNLQLQIYGSSNVSVTNSSNVNVWFSSEFYPYFYDGAFEIWNSTNIQIYNNSFVSFGESVMVYNPSNVDANISIYSNEFVGLSVVNSLTPEQSAFLANSFDFGSQQYGIQLFSSHDKVFRNAFVTQNPVQSYDYNIYCGNIPSTPYGNDSFNTTNTVATTMNGWNLTGPLGTITLSSSELGNLWWNYNGVGTYNDSGTITTGTDMAPLSLSGGANITFVARSGANGVFEVSMGGLVQNGAAGVPVTYNDLHAGIYVYSYLYVNSFSVTSLTVNTVTLNPATSTTVVVTSAFVNLTFTETGLTSGTTWTVYVN